MTVLGSKAPIVLSRPMASSRLVTNQMRNFSLGEKWKPSRKTLLAMAGALTVGSAGIVYALDNSVFAGELQIHPPHFSWPHQRFFGAFDHASVRRGYEVYKQVCSSCHSAQYVAFRNLVDETHTVDEAKREAAEYEFEDGPNEEGEMFTRPGRLTDYFPKPYKNEQAARFANNGALPPDLTYIVMSKEGNENYVFSLLTGYCDPPAGVQLMEGQHYNPYFPGGAIGMARALFDGIVDYSDGTEATASQMAKDVVAFLSWCALPEYEHRMRLAIKAISFTSLIFVFILCLKRHRWSFLKSRKLIFKPPQYKN